MTKNLYEMTVNIPEGQLSAQGLMTILEDAAEGHVTAMGVSTNDLRRDYSAFWMLTRCLVRLNNPISGACTLKCVTCHREISGVLVYRDFDLFIDEKPVGEAIQAWVIAETDSRKMLRPSTMPAFDGMESDGKKTEKLPKLKAPESLTFAGSYVVSETDIDQNGHMNNSKYLAAAQSLLPEGEKLAGFKVGYLKERRLGDEIKLFSSPIDGGSFIHGECQDGTPCFDVEMYTK